MTIKGLLKDDNYLCGCREWERDRRCPFYLIDHLMDLGFDGAAEGARWCHEFPDRFWQLNGHTTKCGPYPKYYNSRLSISLAAGWSWHGHDNIGSSTYSDHIHAELLTRLPVGDVGGLYYSTPLLAITALLSGWEQGFRPRPQKPPSSSWGSDTLKETVEKMRKRASRRRERDTN